MRIALLLSIFLSLSSWAQIIDFRTFTKQLCSPEFSGRGYVKNGDSIAAVFIENCFKSIGLRPIAGTYFQSFSFSVNTFPKKILVCTETDTLRPGIDFLVAPNSCGINKTIHLIRINPSAILSENINLKTLQDDEALVIDYSGLPKDSLKLVKNKINDLAKRFPLLEITDEKLTWSVSQEVSNYFHLIIAKSSMLTIPLLMHLNIEQKYIAKHDAVNVIGYCPSRRKTKNTILVSAHYDHLGCMGEGTYFPGANDNASGTAMLVHLAEQLIKRPLKYNVLFVAFAGEEIGLLGSRYMTLNPIVPLADIRFMLNLDIMGSGEEGITVVNSTLFPKEFELLRSINFRKKLIKEVKPRGPAANSDHYYFTEAGVPAFFIYTMGPNKHYHDVEDRYEALSFDAFSKVNSLLLTFLKEIK